MLQLIALFKLMIGSIAVFMGRAKPKSRLARNLRVPGAMLAVASVFVAVYYAATVDINETEAAKNETALLENLPLARFEGSLNQLSKLGLKFDRIAVIHPDMMDVEDPEFSAIQNKYSPSCQWTLINIGAVDGGVGMRAQGKLRAISGVDCVVVLAGSTPSEALLGSKIEENKISLIYADGLLFDDWAGQKERIKVIAGLQTTNNDKILESLGKKKQVSLSELFEATGKWTVY
ncbi:MAG: hypothetical protein RL095_2699 [Verrucomicrobiota bacterium]|jgi:hypothetical protein